MEAQNNLKDRLSSFGLKRSVGRDGHPWDLNDLMRVKKRTSEKSPKYTKPSNAWNFFDPFFQWLKTRRGRRVYIFQGLETRVAKGYAGQAISIRSRCRR